MTDNRILRRALTLGAFIASVAVSGTLSAQQKHGDVNGDGVVSALDAQAILTAVVGLPLPQGFVAANGDADCVAPTPGALDAQIVLSYVIGLNVAQYCVGEAFGPASVSITLTPGDTSLLVFNPAAPSNPKSAIRVRAILTDLAGNNIQRPVSWSTTNSDLVAIDSARGDTAWVSNKGVAFDAAATITATADGVSQTMSIRVFRSYAGIVIVPQRPDTLRQLNGTTNFFVRGRDSLGTLTTFPTANWSTANATIASVPGTASNNQNVTALTMGSTFLFATSTTDPDVKDSVQLVVQLPAQNTCSGTGGTLHANNTYTTPQTWSPSTNPHYLTGTQDFQAGSRLTIEPGTLICTDFGFMVFRTGSRLTAIGTADQPIVFKPSSPSGSWSGIQLGDFTSLQSTPPPDTSVLTNVIVERASNGSGAINGRERHVVLMDSVTIRQSWNDALALMTQGSRMIRSRIDTLLSSGTFEFAATIGRGSIEETTIRTGSTASSVHITEAGTLRQVSIVGGDRGIVQQCCSDSARINDVTITGAQGVALQLEGGLIHPLSANVAVTGGGGGVFRGQIGNFGHLFSDSLKQETLKNNGKDTVFITGGALVAVTQVVRPDLPWVVTSTATIDTMAVLSPRPGADIRFENSAMLWFQKGGRMNAIGEATKFIRFGPLNGSTNFGGLRFDSPGAGSNPALQPTAVSTMTYVRVDSASGQGVNEGWCCFTSAIAGATRHRLELDSVVVHKAFHNAVLLNAKGSFLTRGWIDTTGTISTNYVTSQPAVVLNDSTRVESSLIARSGQNGIYAPGVGARLMNVRVVDSEGVGLQADNGILDSTSIGVRLDSANAYPFHGKIENFGILAGTAALQTANLLGNTDNKVHITGGALTRDTVEAIPALRWVVQGTTTIDTLARLVAQAGADLTFMNTAFLWFQKGGHLNATGTPTSFVRFRPTGTGEGFGGLRFDSPGQGPNPALAPTAVSTLTYVRVDSASGQGVNEGVCCYTSAIASATRHRVQLDSVIVHKAFNNAVILNAKGSFLTRGWIDTTGNISSNYTNSQPALVLNDSARVENTLIARSGQNGIYAPGTRAKLTNVRVVDSEGIGLQADNGILDSTSVGVRLDSANAYPFHGRIENFGIVAGTATLQTANLLGNNDNKVHITGGALTRDTVDAIPALRWVVQSTTTIDTLARMVAQAGSDVTFMNSAFLWFQKGGHLNATGTPASFVRFRPTGAPGEGFGGLRFDSPGAGANPALAPTAVSTMQYVRVDSASGQGVNEGRCCFTSAIAGATRHRLELDSVIVHKAFNNAVVLNAKGSFLTRGWIDTTGTIGSNYVTSQPAVVLNDSARVENSLIARSGQNGIYAPGEGARLTSVRVVGSRGIALQADVDVIDSRSTDFSADSLNGSPFVGRIENLGYLAADALTQESVFGGNLDSTIVITSGTLTGRTLETSRSMRWRVQANVQIGATAQLRPLPGSRLKFTSGAGFWFLNGGRLLAQGTSVDSIYFSPDAGVATFAGLRFDGTTEVEQPSLLEFVRIDSASGQGSDTCCTTAAINAGASHQVVINNSVVRRSSNGAIHLRKAASTISGVLVDTTGSGAGFTTSQSAIYLQAGTDANNLLVRRSGNTGIFVDGTGITMSIVRVVNATNDGVHISSPAAGIQLGGFVVDSNQAGGSGVLIAANNVQLSACDVTNSMNHGIATSSSFTGTTIADCNILGNGRNGTGLGVSNANTTGPTFVIIADDNWWGFLDGQSNPIPPPVGVANGISANVQVNSVRPSPRTP